MFNLAHFRRGQGLGRGITCLTSLCCCAEPCGTPRFHAEIRGSAGIGNSAPPSLVADRAVAHDSVQPGDRPSAQAVSMAQRVIAMLIAEPVANLVAAE